MSILILSIVLSALFAGLLYAGCAYLSRVISKKSEAKAPKKPKKIYLLTVLGPLLGIIIIVSNCFVTIPQNNVGIIYDELKGGLQEKTLGEGLHSKSLFERITVIQTINKYSSIKTDAQTSDGQYATFDISLIYRIDSKDAGLFFKRTNSANVPSEGLNTIVKQNLQSQTIGKNIFELLSDELETTRVSFESALKKHLYDTYYINLISASFDEVSGDPEVEKILSDLAKSKQEIEKAELEAQATIIAATAEAEAISKIGEANGKPPDPTRRRSL
jgi:regulator of protease activity HflC (stomatin/prohibitin superfamily)